MVAILKKYPDLSNEIKLLTDPYFTDNLSDNSRKSVFKLMDKFFSWLFIMKEDGKRKNGSIKNQ